MKHPYYAVVNINSGQLCCEPTKFAIIAAKVLNPGTTYGRGETPELAAFDAEVSRRQLLAGGYR